MKEAIQLMSVLTPVANEAAIVYPESDGQPMSDNTLQFQWIVTIQGGLDALFRDNPNVFVAGDLLWYPVEGAPKIRAAPDAMVVFGRRKEYRGSYLQWREDNIPPQVVFEVQSPGNSFAELLDKFQFYERYGVEEYYLYDPEARLLSGWQRSGAVLQRVPQMDGWTSPRLGTRFDLSGGELRILGPDGRPFATYVELAAQRDQAQQQADQARQRADRLAAQLRALGVEPEA
jgi:Uma2 family endonuclease